MTKGIPNGEKKKWTDDLKRTFLKAHLVEKLTDKQIAERMGLRMGQVFGLKNRLAEGKLDALKAEVLGIPAPPPAAPAKPQDPPA